MARFNIRQATVSDVENIRAAHRKSILDLAAKDYPAEVIAEWGGNNNSDTIDAHREAIRTNEELVWVVEIDGIIEGFSSLVPNNEELRALYVTAAASKQGIGSKLLEILEKKAIEIGLTKLKLHSSVTAREFYEKYGYKNLGAGSHRMTSGMTMACFIMEKELPAAPKTRT